MAGEWETSARAELEPEDRENKVAAFLGSGHAGEVADRALAAYWDYLEATARTEMIGTDLRIEGYRTKRNRTKIRELRAEQDQARGEASVHLRTAVTFASIAGAVSLARAERRTVEQPPVEGAARYRYLEEAVALAHVHLSAED